MDHFIVRSPETAEEFVAYYTLRWKVLRAPWNQPLGSEKDDQENSSYHLAVFTEDKRVVACGRLQLNSKDEAQVRYMAVDPDFQRKDLGRNILAGLETEALEKSATKVILQARENALEFYVACGYLKMEKTFLLYDTIQHFKMEKQLVVNTN